ncbi:MAG: hypothetical protein Q9217_002670 [Psora testacea]
MASKKILIGPPYNGFLESEDHARVLIQTYRKANLLYPTRRWDKVDWKSYIRSRCIVIYQENDNGLEFSTGSHVWEFIGIEGSIRVSRDASGPAALMMKEFNEIADGYVGSQPRADNNFKLNPEAYRSPLEIIRLSAKDTDRRSRTINWDEDLKDFTVDDIPYVRELKYEGFEMVIAQSRIPELHEVFRHRYDIEYPYNPLTPHKGEVNVHGERTAKGMAYERFLNNAVDAIRNGWGVGASRCYRETAEAYGLEVQLERILRTSDEEHEAIEEDNDCVTLAV